MKKIVLLIFLLPQLIFSQWVQTDELSQVGFTATDPLVVVDKKREAVAIWNTMESIPNSCPRIRGEKLPPEEIIWVDESDIIVRAPTETLQQSNLTMDRKCNALAIWDVPGSFALQAARLKAGETTWNLTEDILVISVAEDSLKLGVDACGNAVAIWIEEFFGPRVVSSTLSCGSNEWTTPISITPVMGNFSSTDLAVNLDGRAVAVWLEDDEVQGAILPKGETKWTLTVNSASPPNSITPKVAIDNCGCAVVVYVTAGEIRGATLPFGAILWKLTDVASTTFLNSKPHVVKDCRGNATAIWNNMGNFKLQGAELPASTSNWVNQQNISIGNHYIGFPHLVIDDLGNAVATWVESGVTLNSAIKPFDRNWELTNTLFSGQSIQGSDLAISPDGAKAVAVWTTELGVAKGAAAFNLLPPLPPEGGKGEQVVNCFSSQSEAYNRIYWRASPSVNVASYKILRNGELIGTIAANKNFVFIDRNQSVRQKVCYQVIAVSVTGKESLPFKIWVDRE